MKLSAQKFPRILWLCFGRKLAETIKVFSAKTNRISDPSLIFLGRYEDANPDTGKFTDFRKNKKLNPDLIRDK